MKTKKINLGRVGLVPKGAYSPDATYGRMHVVTYKNTTYWSKQEGNTGHEPLGEDEWWGILVDGQAAYAGAFNANEATVRANTAAEKAEHTNAAVETAEQERRSAETERDKAEEQRKAQAQSMAEAEQARADAEQSRVEAETQRVEAEERRASEETLRAAAEDTRKSDEADRIAGETSREQQEDSRVAAEQTRDAQETQRKIDETKRAGAETKRADAEDARKEAETGRASAETGRAAAETARSKAETARVDAESKRAAAETKRETDFSAKVEEVNTAVTNANTATAGAEKVDATITDANVFEVTGRDGVKKSLELVGQAEAATIKTELTGKFDKASVVQELGDAEDKVISQKVVSAELSDLHNNSNITFNAVDKIIELPTSYGVLKKQYLHASNIEYTNNAARLYCVYIDGACKISASNLSNMQDGYNTRCWAAYSEREINGAYLVSEFSDPSTASRRKGVSCELDIPETVKMVCFSSLADTIPSIKVTKMLKAAQLDESIESNTEAINRVTTTDNIYSGADLVKVLTPSNYRLNVSNPSNGTVSYLYYPKEDIDISIKNAKGNGNSNPVIVFFKDVFELNSDTSVNWKEHVFEDYIGIDVPNYTFNLKRYSIPKGVKMIYFYSPVNNSLEFIEHKNILLAPDVSILKSDVSTLKSDVSTLKEFPIYMNTEIVDTEYDFDEQSVIAKFFADRLTHRKKYINSNSRKVYWSPNNGNDSNDGLTESTAVKTYEKANSLLSDGSELYIERGSVITELCKFNYNGLLIDVYGSESFDNPIFDNFIETKASEWSKVEGYDHIYKMTKHLEASGDNINFVQVAVDGHNISNIHSVYYANYTGVRPSVSNWNITTLEEAMNRLSNNLNEAWCSCYEGEYSFEEGNYDIYISLPDEPSNHKIEVTNHMARCLIEWHGWNNDIRHINTRGSSGKDGWQIFNYTYMEDCHIYDFCHHGFLQMSGIMRMYNCSAEAPKGAIGYFFHNFCTQQNHINNVVDMFINCTAISYGQEGSCYSGHGSSSSTAGKDSYIINAYAFGVNQFLGDPTLIRNLYVKNCRVENIASIGKCASNLTIINNIHGTLNQPSHGNVFNAPIRNLRAKNVVLKINSEDGVSGILYDTQKDIIAQNCFIKDSKFYITKTKLSETNPPQSHFIFRGVGGGNFLRCVFIDKFNGAEQANEKLSFTPDISPSFEQCLFFGVKDNRTSQLGDNQFLEIGDIDNTKYFSNLQYIDNGMLKMFK